MMNFEGRIVAVTGAGSGFGRAIATSFAERGARVFGCDIQPAGLAQIASVPNVTTEIVDLSDRAAAAGWITGIETATGGALDVLVNNAGGTMAIPFSPIEEVTDADWDRLFAGNIHAAFATCRAAVPKMKAAGRGAIVNIASGAGLKPSLTGVQGYTSSKHAVVGLTRQLAQELGQFGIRVNAVQPGLVLNDEAKRRRWDTYDAAKQAATMAKIAMRRLGTNQDIANAVLFLASDFARMTTGHVLSTDGGAL